MLCNILEYCSPTLDIHGHRVLQLILFLFMTLFAKQNIYDFICKTEYLVAILPPPLQNQMVEH
jgi:hypothetical protein